MSNLYRKHNYTNKKLNTINDLMIREYDMKSAGLNILYNKNVFNEKQYNRLMKKPKYTRNYLIGKFLQANPSYNKLLMDEFIEIRKKFFELNKLEDEDILSIKKDALFVIDKKCNNLIFDNYEFSLKNEYTTFLQFNNKEFYLNKYTKKMDIKGYSEETKKFQKDYYFKFIEEIMLLGNNKDEIFKKLIEFKYKLLNYELPIEYYKDIDFNSYLFIFNNASLLKIDDIDKNDIDYDLLFINNNVSVVNILCNYYL